MKKHVLLIGGYQKALALSQSLLQKGVQITIINEDYKKCLELAELDKVNVIQGDGTRPYVLEDAGAYDADIAIALTRSDDDNLVISELCKKKFNVKRTFALVNDPQKIDFFYKMGVDSVVCEITAVTSIIEQQAFMEEISSNIPIRDGRVHITQVPISNSAKAVNKKLWEIELPKDVIIGCILRGEENIIPRGDTKLLAGDILLLIASEDQQKPAIKKLIGR